MVVDRLGKYYLSLDIGGTKTSAAVFDENGNIKKNYVYTTKSVTDQGKEKVYENTRNAVNSTLRALGMDKKDLKGIGVGAPGPLNVKKGEIIHAPLMNWTNFPLVKRLCEDYGIPVCLENDGNLGALAENMCGRAVGKRDVIYITVSTGIGGGFVHCGQIYHGSGDGALEAGHITVFPSGLKCPCGSVGCLELYASGTAITKKIRDDMKEGKIKSIAFEMAGYDERLLNSKVLYEAALKNDKYAQDIFRSAGEYLGIGIGILFTLFDPDVLVIGGGVSKASKFFIENLMYEARQHSINPIRNEQIQISDLCDRVVLYGAYYLIKNYLKKEDGI